MVVLPAASKPTTVWGINQCRGASNRTPSHFSCDDAAVLARSSDEEPRRTPSSRRRVDAVAAAGEQMKFDFHTQTMNRRSPSCRTCAPRCGKTRDPSLQSLAFLLLLQYGVTPAEGIYGPRRFRRFCSRSLRVWFDGHDKRGQPAGYTGGPAVAKFRARLDIGPSSSPGIAVERFAARHSSSH